MCKMHEAWSNVEQSKIRIAKGELEYKPTQLNPSSNKLDDLTQAHNNLLNLPLHFFIYDYIYSTP